MEEKPIPPNEESLILTPEELAAGKASPEQRRALYQQLSQSTEIEFKKELQNWAQNDRITYWGGYRLGQALHFMREKDGSFTDGKSIDSQLWRNLGILALIASALLAFLWLTNNYPLEGLIGSTHSESQKER
jgi:hypothetical protein